MLIENHGGQWRRSTGEVIQRHQVFDATELEFSRMQQRRQIGTRFKLVDAAAEPSAASAPVVSGATPGQDTAGGAGSDSTAFAAATGEASTPPAEPPENVDETAEDSDEVETPETPVGEWPLKMSPKLYLQLHPQGRHAALAQQVIAATEDTDASADE